MDATDIRTLHGRTISRIIHDPERPIDLLFLDEDGEIICRVHAHHVFDLYGDFFDDSEAY